MFGEGSDWRRRGVDVLLGGLGELWASSELFHPLFSATEGCPAIGLRVKC